MYALTIAYLASPNWFYTPTYCTYTYINLVVGHRYLVHLHCGDFSLFSILFSSRGKKAQNANKRISDFFPLRCFWAHFLFLFAYLRFVLLFGCVLCFWCFCCVQNLFVKKNKGFKTALITSFILLLNLSCYKHEFFNNYNLFQSLHSFWITTIFFNYHNPFQLWQTFSIITIFFNYHDLFQSQYFSITIIFNHYHELLYYNLFYHNIFESQQLVTLSLWK